jgi:hypothetical protein
VGAQRLAATFYGGRCPALATAMGPGGNSLFQRLAQRLQGIAAELGQLVEEEDAVVGEAHLPRAGNAAAADEAGVGDRVMRRAEGRRARRAWPAGRRPAIE